MKAMEAQHGAAKPAATARAGATGTAASAGGKAGEAAGAEDAFAALLDGLCPQGAEGGAAADATAEILPVAAEASPATGAPGTPATPPGQPAPADAFLAMLMPGAMVAGATVAPGGKLPTLAGAAQGADAAAPATKGAGAGAAQKPDAVPDAFLAAATDLATKQPASASFGSVLAATQGAPALEERRETVAAVPDPGALAGLNPAGTQAPAMATDLGPAMPVHEAEIASHPLDAAFAGDLGAEVQWMVDAGVQQADLHLNPADLGPIRIQLSLTAQTADISFAAAHGATREGLAQALPQLREMLAGQGLQLGQAGISGGQGGQSQPQPERQAPRAPARAASNGTVAIESTRPRTASLKAGRGMLDLYA